MKVIYATDRTYVPAAHENPLSPGVWKKVLLRNDDLQPGRVQMINWAKLPVGKSFAAHYHEDMQEVFIFLKGAATITVGDETAVLRCGDSILIDAREVHRMVNQGDEDVEYLAMGIAGQANGRTIVVEDEQAPRQTF